MTTFQLLNGLEKAGLLELLVQEGIISSHIFMRYERYKAFLEYYAAHPKEKRRNIIIDWAIELRLSTQSVYNEIRLMEKQIL